MEPPSKAEEISGSHKARLLHGTKRTRKTELYRVISRMKEAISCRDQRELESLLLEYESHGGTTEQWIVNARISLCNLSRDWWRIERSRQKKKQTTGEEHHDGEKNSKTAGIEKTTKTTGIEETTSGVEKDMKTVGIQKAVQFSSDECAWMYERCKGEFLSKHSEICTGAEAVGNLSKEKSIRFSLAVDEMSENSTSLAHSQLKKALAILGKTGFSFFDEYTCTALVSLCGKAGEIDLAEQMVHDLESVSQIRPNTYVYNALIDACGKGGGRVSEILEKYEDMKRREICPNVVTLNSLLNSLVQNIPEIGSTVLWRGSGETKREEKRRDDSSTRERSKLFSSGYFLAGEMQSMEEGEFIIQRMESLVREFRSFGVLPNEFTFSTLLVAHARNADVENAMLMWQRMVEAGFKPRMRDRSAIAFACRCLPSLPSEIFEKYFAIPLDASRGRVKIEIEPSEFSPLLASSLTVRNPTREEGDGERKVLTDIQRRESQRRSLRIDLEYDRGTSSSERREQQREGECDRVKSVLAPCPLQLAVVLLLVSLPRLFVPLLSPLPPPPPPILLSLSPRLRLSYYSSLHSPSLSPFPTSSPLSPHCSPSCLEAQYLCPRSGESSGQILRQLPGRYSDRFSGRNLGPFHKSEAVAFSALIQIDLHSLSRQEGRFVLSRVLDHLTDSPSPSLMASAFSPLPSLGPSPHLPLSPDTTSPSLQSSLASSSPLSFPLHNPCIESQGLVIVTGKGKKGFPSVVRDEVKGQLRQLNISFFVPERNEGRVCVSQSEVDCYRE